MRTASRAEASPAQRGFRASAHGSGPQRSGPDAGGRRSPREPVRRRRALFARLRTHHLTHPPPPQVALLLSHDIGGHIMTSHACRPTKMRPSTLGPSCILPPSTGKGPPAHAPGCMDAWTYPAPGIGRMHMARPGMLRRSRLAADVPMDSSRFRLAE